jgi:hypothetical protein
MFHGFATLTKHKPGIRTRFVMAALLLLCGCKPTPTKAFIETPKSTFPTRPTVAPPAFKIFHQDNDTYTLVTKEDATNDEITAIVYQLRDAAHNKGFAALQLSQTFVDARQPTIWFHIYRGAKCASEKFTKGPLPCEAAYHGAGDYTLGSLKTRYGIAASFTPTTQPRSSSGTRMHLTNRNQLHPLRTYAPHVRSSR